MLSACSLVHPEQDAGETALRWLEVEENEAVVGEIVGDEVMEEEVGGQGEGAQEEDVAMEEDVDVGVDVDAEAEAAVPVVHVPAPQPSLPCPPATIPCMLDTLLQLRTQVNKFDDKGNEKVRQCIQDAQRNLIRLRENFESIGEYLKPKPNASSSRGIQAFFAPASSSNSSSSSSSSLSSSATSRMQQ